MSKCLKYPLKSHGALWKRRFFQGKKPLTNPDRPTRPKGGKMKCCYVCGKLIYENERSISIIQFNLDPDDEHNNLVFNGTFSNSMGETVSLCTICTVKTFAIFARTLEAEKEEHVYSH